MGEEERQSGTESSSDAQDPLEIPRSSRRDFFLLSAKGAAAVAVGASVAGGVIGYSLGRTAGTPSANTVVGDQIILKGLTADPAGTPEGAFYYRSDLLQYRVIPGGAIRVLVDEIQDAGVLAGLRPILNFKTGFSLTEDGANNRIDVEAFGTVGFGAPTGAIDIGDSAVEGASSNATRADHQHEFAAPLAGYPQDVANAEADGTSTRPARADHVHAHGTGYTLANAHDEASVTFDTVAGHFHDGVGSRTLADLITSESSPASLGADQNNYALPDPAGLVRLTSSVQVTITGFAAPSSSRNRIVVLRNIGSFNIVLADESGLSSVSNRIRTGLGASMVVPPNQTALLIYDGTSTRWQVAS